MTPNPHPDAGVVTSMLTVGTTYVCIPCTVKSRHSWATRALRAESELRDLRTELERQQDKRLHQVKG